MCFKRLRELTTNPNDVVAAIRNQSNVVEISDDGLRIRRQAPMLSEVEHRELIQAYKRRSVFIVRFSN